MKVLSPLTKTFGCLNCQGRFILIICLLSLAHNPMAQILWSCGKVGSWFDPEALEVSI